MKRIACLLLACLLAAGLGGCTEKKNEPEEDFGRSPQEIALADNSTPEGAVIGLMEAIIRLDMGVAAQFISGGGDGPLGMLYQDIMLPFVERLEYEVGAARITGDTAVVDIAILAVDAEGALNDLVLAGAKYLIGQMLRRESADLRGFVAEYAAGLDVGAMTRVRRDAAVLLVRDSAGKWRLDADNEENYGFLNALSGGLLGALVRLQELADEYGISWTAA